MDAILEARQKRNDGQLIFRAASIDAILAQTDALRAERDALAARVTELEAAARWHPVSEGLPDKRDTYMFGSLSYITHQFVIAIEYYEPGQRLNELYTHWKLRPQPPESEVTHD